MRYLVKDKSQQAVVINIQYKQIPGGPLDPCYSHCSVEYRVGCRRRQLIGEVVQSRRRPLLES